MRRSFLISLMLLALNTWAGDKKHYFPAWTSHVKHANIYGVSAGVCNFIAIPKDVHTYGMHVSLIGEGILSFMLPYCPVPNNDSAFQSLQQDSTEHTIAGISLSTSGTMGNNNINGFSANGIIQIVNKVNGLSIAVAQNYVMVHNGIQASFIINEAYKMRGMQIGAINKSRQTRGLQVGIWNVNEKRKMPFINWNFRKARV